MKNIEQLPKSSGIYQILNLINGHCYIGQSKNIFNRFNKHHIYDYKNEKGANYNDKIYQALRKYGLENFKVNIIELCPLNELDDKEIYWISYFDSFKNGYNSTIGGQNWSPNMYTQETEEKRQKTREKNQSLIGENHPRAKLSNEEVENIRQRYILGESVENIWKDYQNNYQSKEVFKNIIFGQSYENVNKINKEDIRYTNAKLTKEQVLDIRKRFYLNDETFSEISKYYNISISSVKNICNRTAYKHIEDDIPDLRKRKTYRLTVDQVRDIRKKYAKGMSLTEIAKEYNISLSAISRCCQRITYSNIE